MTELTAKSQYIKEFFDEDSKQYIDERYPTVPRTCDQFSYLIRQKYVLEMLDQAGKPGRILDIGCGPAVYTAELVRRGWNVCGMDISTGMLQTAARSAKTLKGRAPVKFAAAQASELPYRDGSFDAVLCIGVVSYVTDVPLLLREVRRVLRPGGQAIFQISNSLAVAEVDVRLRRYLGKLMPRRGELDAHDRFRAKVLLNPYTPRTFDTWMRESRLDQQEYRFFDFRPPLVIDRLAPGASLAVGRQLESMSRSRMATPIGSGYLVRVSRGA